MRLKQTQRELLAHSKLKISLLKFLVYTYKHFSACSGYMSPEYALDGRFSTKSDVYSFGVLVLEIVSGKRNRGFIHPEHDNNLIGHVIYRKLTCLLIYKHRARSTLLPNNYFLIFRHGDCIMKEGQWNSLIQLLINQSIHPKF